ncbi:Brca2 [Columba guinea]|nr:Brca2 [Columba guinea]
MDKKMAYSPVERPTFFEMFKAHCSESEPANLSFPSCENESMDEAVGFHLGRDNLISPSITRRKVDQENEIFASPHGTCHNCLAARTIWKFVLHTKISGARENDSISGAKQQGERADIALQSFVSNHDKCPGTSDTGLLSVPETVKPNAEDDIKDFESEMLDALFGEMNSFEDTFNMPANSNGTLLLMPRALDVVEKCEINTDKAQGKGDVPCEQSVRRKAGISHDLKTTSQTENSLPIEMNDSLLQNIDEDMGAVKDSCSVGHEKELESLTITGDVQDYRTYVSAENEKPMKEAVPSSSSQWSQLSLSDLDVTHLETSLCSSPSSDFCREKNLGDKSVLVTKDDAVETSLLNTSGFIKAQKLLSANLSGKCYDVQNSENNQTWEITPVKSVSEEKIQKEVTSESPAHPILPHLESDSCEFKGCRVASVDDQERKCLQSNVREKNFSTCTLKMDTLDNSSDNLFNNRLKQQDLRDLGENAREDQPATLLKCLELSNNQKEDTTNSLNSELISNIKRKVLTSARLMARKHSRLLLKGCCLEKGKEDKYMSANVNVGATVPQNLKEELVWSSRNNERLSDTHHDTMSGTNDGFNNTLSRISFGINGLSSDCHDKISTDKKCATDQRSVVDCREVLGPLGINSSESDNIGLKQGEKTDAAAFSEVVANNEEPKSAENNGSAQAAAVSNVPVETAKELLDCIGDSSLNEVISEDNKQVAPMYSSKKPNENLKYKGKPLGNLNACSFNLGFGGFQTASNKQIKFSEVSLAKGKMLFRDIENECFEAYSMERVRNFSNQVKKDNLFFSDSESKSSSNLSDSLDSQTSCLEPRHTQLIPHKAGLCKSFPRSQQSLQEKNQTLTASQEAEIAELSSILEETGSQFEFTQFRKQSNMIQSQAFQQFRSVGTHGAKNVENISETREDADFCSTFISENQVKNDKYCTKQEDTNEDTHVVEYKGDSGVVFHKNDKKVTFTNSDRNGSRMSDESFPVAKQDGFSSFVGFTSAGGKKISVSKAALKRSAELFRDLDDDNYLLQSSETSTTCHSSNGHMSSNCNFVRCMTKENKKIVCVSGFKSMDAVSHTDSIAHHAQEKNEENTSTPFKENTENERTISTNNTENYDSTSTIVNGLSSIKKHNQNLRTSKQFFSEGDCQVEGSLQEDSLDVTCPGNAITTAEERSLSDEMENLSPNWKEGVKQENEPSSQKCQTPAGGDVSISHVALDNALHLLNVQCGERDVNVLENCDKQKTNSTNMEAEDTTHEKILLVNESGIKLGSYHHHQIPFEQEVNVEKNEVKESYLTDFHTATGKKITIADGFLAKAEHFFAENVDLAKEHCDSFENPLKKRKCGKNCVKDLCVESIAHCDPEKLDFDKKLVPKEPGDQFKQTVESSPIKHTVILDTVKVDTFVNLGEDCKRSSVASYAHKKADVRPGKPELESFLRQESDALTRTHLSEGGKLFAERERKYSAKKRDDSEITHDFPVHSAASLHLMKVSNDLADNSVPGDTKNTSFVEDSNSNQSLLLTSESSSSHLNCDSEFELEHLNKPCADTNCFTDTIVNASESQALVSPTEHETNLTSLKETSLKFENQKDYTKQIVFSTAKGKRVSVSESALARVRQMFQEDCSESVKYEIETKSRTDQAEIAGNSSWVIHAKCPNSVNFLSATRSEEINSASCHVIKVNASASDNGHQDTNTCVDSKSVPNSQRRHFEQNVKLLGHLPVPDKQINQPNSSTSNLGFFSTASGKPVQLSEESLRKARQLFSEMESNHSSHLQEPFLVEEAVEESEMHTDIVPRKMQVVLPKEEENASTELISDPAFGFSTASGKQVTVSKNAYQKAKAILKESDFLRSELGITDQFSSINESGQHAESSTDEVISESKIEKSCNEDFNFKSIYAEEMKSLPSSHHVKIPEYIPHSKKNEQLTSFKNSFQQEETRSSGKGQLNLGMKTDSEAISCNDTARAEINTNLLQTPRNYLEMEAVESARAFMEDDSSDSGVQIEASQSFSGRLDKNFQMLKVVLLNKEYQNPSKYFCREAETCMFKCFHLCRATKERQEVKNPTLTVPDQDFKGFKSKPAIFQHCALRQSSNATAGFSTPCKAPAKESEETRSLYKSGKAVKTFIPPFKTKLTFSASEQGSGSRICDSPIRKNVTEEMELNQVTTQESVAEPQDHQSCIQHAADTDVENGDLAMVQMLTNLRCARDLQEMRIKKKYRQNISSQPGSLYVIKTSARNRISLKTAVEEKSPGFYSTEELYTYGVSKHCLQINSTNAESFQFLIEDFFGKEYLLAGNGMQLADGGWLIPTDEGKAGKKEFYRALCDTPGVDPKLITETWVYNHYRWIVWKLAAMEVSFPHEFANRCLTPETVLLQLKYRYDLEVDKSKRSAIKKITERDDAAGKTLVLCISKIISLNTVVSPSSSNKNLESKKAAAIIEVTDGWYGIRALLDPPLKAFLHRRRLTIGQKIIVHGAELVGSQNGCTPLEAPDSLMLKWMEKTSAGSYVFRNNRAEEREAAKHAEDQQKKLEALFAKIQAEYEKHEERTQRTTPRSRIVTRQQIHNLQDGADLYEAIQNASDPGYMEGYLSEDQLKALNAHRQLMNDKKQTRIREEFKKALESAEQEENSCSKRDVSTVWKLCVVDYRKQEKHKESAEEPLCVYVSSLFRVQCHGMSGTQALELMGFATMVYLSDESYNLVAVKIWTDLRHFAIEDIVVRCSFISASNLQWKSEFRSAIPVLLAGDLSVFSACPKEKYLQEKVNELKSMIEVKLLSIGVSPLERETVPPDWLHVLGSLLPASHHAWAKGGKMFQNRAHQLPRNSFSGVLCLALGSGAELGTGHCSRTGELRG